MNSREKVFELEAHIQQLPQCHIGIKHYFADGVYAREMSAPAGAVVTGKIHKHQQINILSSGTMSVVLGDNNMETVSAPFTVVAPAGSKRAFYCHTDCVWTTILGTDEKDPDVIEETLTTNSEIEYLEFTKQIGKS
jgi:quercetin dioxygenase-like cupin family protein